MRRKRDHNASFLIFLLFYFVIEKKIKAEGETPKANQRDKQSTNHTSENCTKQINYKYHVSAV